MRVVSSVLSMIQLLLCCVSQGASYQPGLSTLHLDKKHLRSVIVFLDVTVNQVGFQHELLTSVQQEKKGLENMFLLFTDVSVRVHLSKTL